MAAGDVDNLGGEVTRKGAWIKWTSEEDDKLREMVNIHGSNWKKIHKSFPGKSLQACYYRWTHHLIPGLRSGQFTEDEDAIILWAYLQYGEKWSAITKHLPTRAYGVVKARWKGQLKKRFGSLLGQLRVEIPLGAITLLDMAALVRGHAASEAPADSTHVNGDTN